MHINLTGRKAIVTGSTAGIGRATAEGLARAGAAVVLNGRGSVRVDEAVRQIRDAIPGSDVSGVDATTVSATLAQEASRYTYSENRKISVTQHPRRAREAFTLSTAFPCQCES